MSTQEETTLQLHLLQWQGGNVHNYYSICCVGLLEHAARFAFLGRGGIVYRYQERLHQVRIERYSDSQH